MREGVKREVHGDDEGGGSSRPKLQVSQDEGGRWSEQDLAWSADWLGGRRKPLSSLVCTSPDHVAFSFVTKHSTPRVQVMDGNECDYLSF